MDAVEKFSAIVEATINDKMEKVIRSGNICMMVFIGGIQCISENTVCLSEIISCKTIANEKISDHETIKIEM